MGLLSSLSPMTITKAVAAIYAGLKEQGFVEGQNLKMEQRWAEGQYERLPALAKELVDLKVAAIVTIGGNIAALRRRPRRRRSRSCSPPPPIRWRPAW